MGVWLPLPSKVVIPSFKDVTGGDSGDIDHLIPEQIDQVIVWRKTEQISWRSF